MNKKATIFVSEAETNGAVTNMYMSTIGQILKRLGYRLRDNPNSINKKNDYIVVDNCKLAMELWLKGYKNIIIWIQGVVPEERMMMKQARYKYYVHSFIENIMLRKSVFLFMVSKEMLNHYQNKYNIALSNKTYIMPCFNENKVDPKAFDNKKKYTQNNFLYAGSLQEWQCFDETVSIYKQIEENIQNTKLVVYTDEIDKAKQILKKYQIKNYFVDHVAPSELGQKINEAKFGFVLRKDSIVNRVATPTKLSNYLSHGIIPIYSPCLKSFDRYNQGDGLAIPLDLTQLNEGLKKIEEYINAGVSTKDVQNWCKKVFNEYYNQQRYIEDGAKKLNLILNH